MAEKYLKYKNKYLNLKKQFGGSEDEFPKLVFDKFIIESCLKENSLIFDTENYEKLKEFFLNIQKNSIKLLTSRKVINFCNNPFIYIVY